MGLGFESQPDHEKRVWFIVSIPAFELMPVVVVVVVVVVLILF